MNNSPQTDMIASISNGFKGFLGSEVMGKSPRWLFDLASAGGLCPWGEPEL